VEKVSLFIDKLGYDPENITVLAPGKAEMAGHQERQHQGRFVLIHYRGPGAHVHSALQ
jgi:hypothetical protein